MSEPFAHPGDELMDAGTFSDLHARLARPTPLRVELPPPAQWSPVALPVAAPRGGAIPSSPASAAALEAEIDCASSREDVARLAVYLARRYASASALLLVHRGIIEALCTDGLPRSPEAVLFPADAANVFGGVAATGSAFRGTPRNGGLDARIQRALGREHVQEIAVLPVRLSGRVVNLLYADNGPEALGDVSTAALTAVCARLAAAYERLIRERKRSARA